MSLSLHSEPGLDDAPDALAPAGPGTILLVDDQSAVLGLLTGHLEGYGFDVVVAQDGEEAIERAELVKPDLILMDVVMPGLGGFETCRRLKAHPGTREIPVVFMTSLSETPQKVLGFEAGAVDYVTKPLDIDEAMVRIRTHMTLHDLKRRQQTQNQRLAQEIRVRRETEAELQRSNAELEQLAYVASHDLQEPLRMVASYLQLIVERYHGKLDADGEQFIGFAVDGARRMQTLISDLLSYSRVGRKPRAFEPADCAVIVDTVLADLKVALQESRAEVTVGPLPNLSGDALHLHKLFQNLIGNAVKFHRELAPPQVEVSAEPAEDGGWTFTVRDNGIGIAAEYFERVFAPFQRLHTRREYPGTGIGLALCRRIVERHGGRIWVESTLGVGSAFHFSLPQAPPA